MFVSLCGYRQLAALNDVQVIACHLAADWG
jgi:hypothetical protein